MNAKATQAVELARRPAQEAAAAGELPAFLGALEAVRVEAILAAAHPMVEPRLESKPDRVLTVKQTATMLGRSSSWVYRNKGMPGVSLLVWAYSAARRKANRLNTTSKD